MAASYTTTATSLEGQVLEIVQKLQLTEQAVTVDPIPNNVTISPDLDNLTTTITVTLPITTAIGSGGKLEIVAAPYLA